MPVVLWWQTSFPRAAQAVVFLTACCWDSSDMWCGRVSPKLGLLFLYLERCLWLLPSLLSLFHLLLPLLLCALFPTWSPSSPWCQSSPKIWGRDESLEWAGICANTQKLLCWRDAAHCTMALHGFLQATCGQIWCAQGVVRYMHLQKDLPPPCWRLPTPTLTCHCLKHVVVLCLFLLKKRQQQN